MSQAIDPNCPRNAVQSSPKQGRPATPYIQPKSRLKGVHTIHPYIEPRAGRMERCEVRSPYNRAQNRADRPHSHRAEITAEWCADQETIHRAESTAATGLTQRSPKQRSPKQRSAKQRA